MNKLLLAAVLSGAACAALAASNDDFDDSDVVISYAPERLWRGADGTFLARREGDKVVLIYDFFGGEDGYSECPTHGGGVNPADTCEASQRAVDDAFQLWAQAAGNLGVRRRSGRERVNFWVTWTTQLPAPVNNMKPRGLSIDNTRDVRQEDPPTVPDAGGFARPRLPDGHKEFGTLAFNDDHCWFTDDESVCPAATNPTGFKPFTNARPLRATALHEGGHVLGFGHFKNGSIMGMAGGPGRYELTPLDREAIRRLYDRVGL